MESRGALAPRPKVAVVTGGHTFDVPNVRTALRSVPEVDYYVQTLGNFLADRGDVADQYDAVVFYNFHRPADRGEEVADDAESAVRALGRRGQGIVVLHHALLSYPASEEWSAVVGIDDRTFEYHHDQELAVRVADGDHPITDGLSAWTMRDETYAMSDPAEAPGHDNRPLLSVDDPRSMPTIAWTRTYRDSRVFCFQSGHGAAAFTNPQFRTVLGRGTRWVASTDST